MAPEDALQLAAERGRLLGTLPEGAMLAVRASERRLRAILPAELALGGIDGAESCVVAGAPDAVAAFGARLCAEGLVASSLPMVRAYHSGAVEAVMPAWRERLAAVALRAPAIPFMSTLNGHWADEREIATADYWARQLREPVRFHAAVERLLEDPAAAFLEVGPGRTLRSLVRWHPHKRPEHVAVACLPRAGESGEDRPRLLRAVGALWLAGVVLDWAALHAGDARRRVELPTYPFQRTRHWIEASPAGETAAQPRDAQRERAELADWFWVPRWREAPLPGGTPATAARGETWLIFASATPVVRALVDQLRAAEAVVLVVEAGTGWREVGPGHFEIDASAAADYQTLLTRLAALGRVPARIIHAWSLDATSADAQERGFFSLVALARALMRVERAPVTLVALTAGMHDLGDDELGVAEQATVLGPVRVIPREQSHVLCKSLDLPVRVRGVGDMARVVDLVLAECMARTAERMVAVRGPHRWVQDYERRSLAPATSLSPVLRAGGTYLITGGLGGIGLAVAAWIAEAAPDVHLVLTGRSAFPAAEAWDAWLAERGADDPTSRRIRALRRLIDLGAVVSVESVDAGDASGMAALVERTIARRGALHGIVHAAGVAGGGLLALRPRDAMLSVLEPKVRGARVLAGIASGVPLDFLVFCSSRTAVGGRAGQVDYVGANAFLDVLAAHLRRSTSAHVVAVDWPAWEQVGMAARANGRREIPEADERQAFGRHPMLTWRLPGKAGVETFATRFSAHEHWPLDEHRIIGRAVMPGVAYFDMVRAALADRCEGRMVVLREVLFREPMHLEDDETREGRLEIRDEGKAEFSFRVWSEETSAPSRRQREHAAGRAALEAPGSRPRCDLAAIRARCPVEVVVAQEDREDDLGPRWQSVRSFRRGHQEVLIELELPEAFAGDWDQWFFHPALLDRAAGLTKKQLCPEHYYLPLVYQGVAMCRPLRGRIFVHGRRLPELEASNEETITFAFDLVDPDGEHLAWVERFVQKRVGDPGAQIRGMADPGPEPAAAAGNAGIHPAQAVEALARVLAAHVEPQVVVSPEDLPSFLTREDWELAGRVLDPAAAPAATPPVPESFTPPLEALTAANSIEARVTELWSEVLGIQSIGLHQDFFEAGGDSLTAIQLLSRIQTAFGVSLAVDALFRAPTIAGVSALVVEEMVSTVTSLPQSELAQRTEAAGEPVPDLPS
jgi:acyl transferase domain-containing protein